MSHKKEVDIDLVLEACQWMWTTHRHEFYLVKSNSAKSSTGYTLVRFYRNKEDIRITVPWGMSSDEAYTAIIQRMVKENITSVSTEEMRHIRDKWLGRK